MDAAYSSEVILGGILMRPPRNISARQSLIVFIFYTPLPGKISNKEAHPIVKKKSQGAMRPVIFFYRIVVFAQ